MLVQKQLLKIKLICKFYDFIYYLNRYYLDVYIKKNFLKFLVLNLRSGNQFLIVQFVWKKCNEYSEIIDSVIFKY